MRRDHAERPRSRNPRRPALERLEPRALLSGDVTVRLSGGHLFIDGDAADNAITLSVGSVANEVRITGRDGTTILGPGSALVTKDVHIRLGGGNDVVNVGGEEHEEGEVPATAEGHDDEELRLVLPGDLAIDAGDGNDRITVRFTTVEGSLTIAAGQDNAATTAAIPDDDIVTLGRGPTFRVDDGSHDDGGHENEAVTTLAEDDGCEGEGGPPADVVIGGAARITTGRGDDRVKVAFSRIGTDLTIATGAGTDSVVTGRGPIAGVHGGGGDEGGGGCEEDLTIAADDGHSGGGRPPDLRVGSGVRLTTDGGADFVMLRNMNAARLDVATGADADDLGLQNVLVAGATALDTFQGDDLVAILDATFRGPFDLRTGTSNDVAWVGGSAFESSATFNGGPGVNDLYLASGNEFASSPVVRLLLTHTPAEAEAAWDLVIDTFAGYLQGRSTRRGGGHAL